MMVDLRKPLDLYEAELADIADAIGERSEGDTMSDDAPWSISLPAGHWRCLEAYVRDVLAATAKAEESSEQVDFAKVRVRSAGWWDDEDGEGRYFRFICALDGDTPPVWPLTKIWGSAFTLAPVSAPAEARSEQPVDPAAPTPRSDRRQPPAGYAKLPAGEHCKCIGLWQQAIGELWCCKGAAVDHG